EGEGGFAGREKIESYVDRLLERKQVKGKIRDSESRTALIDIYRRTHGLSVSGKGLTYMERRAAAAELATIMRRVEDPAVTRLKVVRGGRGARTPDLMEARVSGLGRPPMRAVENVALTGANFSTKPTPGVPGPRRQAPDSYLGEAILKK